MPDEPAVELLSVGAGAVVVVGSTPGGGCSNANGGEDLEPISAACVAGGELAAERPDAPPSAAGVLGEGGCAAG